MSRIALIAIFVFFATSPRLIAQSKVGVDVDLHLKGGSSRSASLSLSEIPIKIEFGTLVLQVDKLKTLEFAHDSNGTLVVSAVLTDHSQFAGTPLFDSLPLVVDDKSETISISNIEKVIFVAPKHTSLISAIVGLISLAMMEIVLGVDNIIVLSILVSKLPENQKRRGRVIGMSAALGTRIALLFTLFWLAGMTRPIFTLPSVPFLNWPEPRGVSLRDLVLFVGGLFLIGKTTSELHEKLEHSKSTEAGRPKAVHSRFLSVIVQIALIDIVFSLDSVITAIGMVDDVWVMVVLGVFGVVVMVWFAAFVGRFVDDHPTIKVLALSFLILIGVMLTAEGLGRHFDKGYIYFAMAFAVAVELINLRVRGAGAAT